MVDRKSPYSWRRRRRFMYIVSAFSMLVVGYVLVKDLQSNAAETAVNFAFICLISNVASYVFGAAYQDVNHMKTESKKEEMKGQVRSEHNQSSGSE